MRSAAIVAAKNYKLRISEYSPREIKKSVTGNGASSKQQVLSIVKSILSIKEKPKFYDASDALSIALCHFFCISRNTLYPVELKNKISTKTGWKEYIDKNPGKIINKRT